MVFKTILEMAISAPVLPAETIAWARPERTASIAIYMLVLRLRITWEGLSSFFTHSAV